MEAESTKQLPRLKLTTMRKVLNGLKWDEGSRWCEYDKNTRFINLSNKLVQLKKVVLLGLVSKTPANKEETRYEYKLTSKGVKVRKLLNELYNETTNLISWY